jgi:hypothetical protein
MCKFRSTAIVERIQESVGFPSFHYTAMLDERKEREDGQADDDSPTSNSILAWKDTRFRHSDSSSQPIPFSATPLACIIQAVPPKHG